MLCCAVLVLCFAACEGYDVMLMTPHKGEGVIKWIVNKRRQGEVEKVRRLTCSHGWQCGNKLVAGIAGLVGEESDAMGMGRNGEGVESHQDLAWPRRKFIGSWIVHIYY